VLGEQLLLTRTSEKLAPLELDRDVPVGPERVVKAPEVEVIPLDTHRVGQELLDLALSNLATTASTSRFSRAIESPGRTVSSAWST